MRRTVPLLIALLLVVIAVPSTAGAAVRHVIRGAGFGHGIGMSQYGAYGYALKGSKHEGILAHYYKGTRMSSAPSRAVRVLLQPDDPYIRVRGATRIRGRELNPHTTYVAREFARRRARHDGPGQADRALWQRGALRELRPDAAARPGAQRDLERHLPR